MDILTDFMNQIPLEPKGKMNIMYCLHAIWIMQRDQTGSCQCHRFPKNVHISTPSTRDKVVKKTKTGEIHTIPCHSDFKPYLNIENKKPFISPFLFKCSSARKKDKRYSNEILNRIWKKACSDAGEDIDMYSGLKHSSCSQFVNEKGLSELELQMVGKTA